MSRLSNILFIMILAFCAGSCMHTSEAGRILDEAEAHLEMHPDSAFVALDSLDRKHLNTQELRARHALLYSIALEKCGIGMTSDSIISIAIIIARILLILFSPFTISVLKFFNQNKTP